jgi:protein involved in polysaccharide export with SLBB domain
MDATDGSMNGRVLARRGTAGVVLMLLLLLPGALAGQAPGPASTALQVGDAVRITVWQMPELSGQFEIGPDGSVVHPLYRSIRMVGLPHPQAEAEVRRVLQRFETNPEFVVEPLFRVAVGGEVRAPNVYTLAPQTSVVMAVTQAGGPTPDARLDRARLLRDGTVFTVDLTRPHSELSGLRIQSGDQIVLDRRTRFWRDRVNPVLTPVGAIASIAFVILRLTGVSN